MRSHSNVILTASHAHSSTTREFNYAPISSKISSLTSHRTHSTSKTSSTLFHYAPLSSTTCPSSSLDHASPSSPNSKAVSSQSFSSINTSQPSSSISTSSLKTGFTTWTPTQTPAHAESLPSGPLVGIVVAVAVLLGILMTIAVAIWLLEVRCPSHLKEANPRQRSAIVDQQGNLPGPMGLGISLQSSMKEKEEAEHEKTRLDMFERMVEKMIDFAVSRSRIELEQDAEEKLLLPFQKDDRVGSKKTEDDIELETVRGC